MGTKAQKNLLSLSVLEARGFIVVIKKGQVLIRPKGASPNTMVSIGVREGKPVSEPKSMTKEEEQEASKDEQQLAASSSRSRT